MGEAPQRVLVFAYQEVGHACLKELLHQGARVVGVVTHRDDPKEKLWFHSVWELAQSQGLRVWRPTDVNAQSFVRILARLRPDFIFSFYFRKILAPSILALAREGAYNLHGSLLPKYRGRCPVNWVLIHGESETGVTLHQMVARADTGPVVAQKRVPIAWDDTAKTLYTKIVEASRALVRATFPKLYAGCFTLTPQDEQKASTFGGRKPEDGRIVWERSSWEIYNLIRAVTHPYPGAFTEWNGRKLLIWKALPLEKNLSGARARASGTLVGVGREGALIKTAPGFLLVREAQWENGTLLRGQTLERNLKPFVGVSFGSSRRK